MGLLLIVVSVAGCSGLGDEPIRRLEADVARSPGEADALRRLGMAYARDGRFDPAYAALRRAEQTAPGDVRTQVLIALVEEGRGNWAEAIARYESVPSSPEYDPFVADRRDWLHRQSVRSDVRALLDAEGYPSTVPRRSSVAVFPLAHRAGDPAFADLGRGFSEWIREDLAALGVPIAEGRRAETVLNELGVSPTTLDPARARRLGRLLQATDVVVGTVAVADGRIEVGAAPWAWEEESAPDLSLVEGDLDDLAAIEARLVLALANRLGMGLTDGDRQRLMDRPSPDAEAFRLYSRGLLAEDAGRFDDAADLYREATRRDPSFEAAQKAALTLDRLQAVPADVQVALASLDSARALSPAMQLVDARVQRLSGSLGVAAGRFGAGRDPAAEVSLRPPAGTPSPFPDPPAPPSTGGN